MGVAQHHDAVSGTEKQEVAFDYAMRLSQGIDSALVINIKQNQRRFIVIENFRTSSMVLITKFYQMTIKQHQVYHSFFVN